MRLTSARLAAFGAVAAVVVAGAAGLGIWAFQQWIAPFTNLPRPEAEIEADWARLDLPKVGPPAPWDPKLAAVIHGLRYDEGAAPVSDESLEPILAWLDRGEPLPALACAGLADPAPDVSAMHLFDVGRQLVRSGYPEHAAELGSQMRPYELLGLMVGKALFQAAQADLDDPAPWADRPEELWVALAWEAACADAMFDERRFIADLERNTTPFLDLEVERLRVRHLYGGLLHQLDPIRHDPVAMRAVLEDLPGGDRHAPLSSIITIGVNTIGLDYLEPPADLGGDGR
jgi:hypothetical protein